MSAPTIALDAPTMPAAPNMPRAFTRVERVLITADIGGAIIAGFEQSSRGARASVAAARATQACLRGRVGYAPTSARVLTDGSAQAKLAKNTVATLGLMLTPERGLMLPALADVRAAHDLGGAWNLCPLASAGCSAACLVFSGQSGMPTAQRAQAVRTAFMLSHPHETGLIIGAELRAAVRRHGRVNLRLNTTSDIRWELVAPTMVATLSAAGVRMYDYTAWRPVDRRPSDVYHLTFSAKEPSHTSDDYLVSVLASGRNVAVPFDTPRGADLPATWHGYRVIDGDLSDERYRDPSGVVVGLRAKGYRWRRDNSAGFIRSAVVS